MTERLKALWERIRGLAPTGLGERLRRARLSSAVGERLRGARYFLADLFFLISRPFRGVSGRLGRLWASVSAENRRRLAVAGLVVVLGAVAWLALIPNLPCAAPGGDECPPPDDAIALVPEDALAYVHVNIDRDTDQSAQAAEVANRTPLLTQQVLGRLLPFFLGASGEPPSFSDDIEPWFGGEIAIAVVPGESGTQQVQMLEVADAEGAREYEASIAAGDPEPEDYQGIDLREDERGLATAMVQDFLVVGSVDGVRTVIDVAEGAEGASSLEEDGGASEALDSLPPERFAEAYLSAEGIDGFLGLSEGELAAFEPLVDAGEAEAAAFALGADESGFKFASRSHLDPGRDPEAGGFFAAFERFQPELPAELAPDTLAYVGFGNASETAGDLLAQATVRAPGVATGVTDLVDRLRKRAGVDLAAELLPALDGEGALAVAPRPEPEIATSGAPDAEEVPDELQLPGAPETIQGGQADVPYAQFLAAGVDEEAASDALARLQGELAKSIDPGIADPTFREETFGDVTAQVLERAPGSVVAYGIFEGMLAIANDTAPVERLDSDPDSGLAGASEYEAALEGLDEEPAFIAFLDLAGLVVTAERLGAGGEGPFATFAEDLRRLQTFALTVGEEEDVLASDARLRIASP